MKEIQLTQGKVALVDDCDFKRISIYKWHAVKYPKKNVVCWYAKRHEVIDGKVVIIRMHNFILGHTPSLSNLEIDHIDRDGLNNTRKNLRIVTKSENQSNRRYFKRKYNTYLGCYLIQKTNKYKCMIRDGSKILYLGYYQTEKECADRFDIEALRIHGINASLNNHP